MKIDNGGHFVCHTDLPLFRASYLPHSHVKTIPHTLFVPSQLAVIQYHVPLCPKHVRLLLVCLFKSSLLRCKLIEKFTKITNLSEEDSPTCDECCISATVLFFSQKHLWALLFISTLAPFIWRKFVPSRRVTHPTKATLGEPTFNTFP